MTNILSKLSASIQSKQLEPDCNEIPKPRPLTHIQKLNQVYRLPVPFRTFPLPSLVPHNPISILHIVYTWLHQIINPVPSLCLPIYEGWFSLETRSVHVTDIRSIRGLWEQGFFGKGSLSRSEPNWLAGEYSSRSNKKATTSEEFTRKRREERQKIKWERARKERQAIEQKLLEEAEEIRSEQIQTSVIPLLSNDISSSDHLFPSSNHKAPIGPMELLSLPNSQSDLKHLLSIVQGSPDSEAFPKTSLQNKASASALTIGNESSTASVSEMSATTQSSSASTERSTMSKFEICDATAKAQQKLNDSSCHLNLDGKFSTANTIETALPGQHEDSNQLEFKTTENEDRSMEEVIPLVIKNEEHFQLTLEEAFFLCYAFGCFQVRDPITKSGISTELLFRLCRQNSYFPPRSSSDLSTDDPFMVNYIVYHHFRSLGWVVRSGIKFSVDYMLYNRGPVFSHAEFAVLILPSYSDSYWTSTVSLRNYSKRKQYRSWAWMSCINRVISQVKKTLILCYVDIPRPLSSEEEKNLGIDVIMARYKIREFVMNRFLTNRMRA